MHRQPHLDEIGALILLRQFGENMGVNLDTPHHYIDATAVLSWENPELQQLLLDHDYTEDSLPCNLTADELEEHCGILFVGTGGGRFDEHPDPELGREVNTSSIRLIADELGEDLPAQLEDFVVYVDEEDARHKRMYCGPLELSQLVRMMQNINTPEDGIYNFLEKIVEGRVRWPKNAAPHELADPASAYEAVMHFMKDHFGEKGQSFFSATPDALAQELGCKSDPAMEQLLTYCRHLESRILEGKVELYEFAMLPRLMFAEPGSLSERSDLWRDDRPSHMKMIATMKHVEQKHFFTAGRTEYDTNKELIEIPVGRKTMKVVFLESTMFGLDRVARKVDQAAIIVIRNPETGHVVILTNFRVLKKLNVGRIDGTTNRKTYLDQLTRMIRIAERRHGSAVHYRYDKRQLIAEGQIPGAENWFYDARIPLLANGTRSAMNVKPTTIPWEELKRLVLTAFDSRIMAPECLMDGVCSKVACTSKLYQYSLKRCRDVQHPPRPDGPVSHKAFLSGFGSGR
ncbi:MAG: hypothetical protein CMI52_02940 [Parcubacteria group bacterium]|nr:hypothetical protein [Parcubacteria group bacterium]